MTYQYRIEYGDHSAEIGGEDTLERTREARDRSVAYLQGIGRGVTKVEISAICGACKGAGKVHREFKRPPCRPTFGGFGALRHQERCWAVCRACNGRPETVLAE